MVTTILTQGGLNELPRQEIGKDWKSALYKAILANKDLISHFNALNNSQEDEDLAIEEEVDF